MRLEGKVALITGAANGIGAASARLFAEDGAKVCIADVAEEQGRQVAANIVESGGDAFFKRLDITSEDDWAEGVDEVVARFGKLNVLVNNAAMAHVGTVEETTAEDWDRVMEVNAKGTFLGTKAAIPAMRRAGGGSIINTSSGAGLVGQSWAAAYNASKAAVHLLAKSTAIQYAREGIRANSVHPGAIDTQMLAAGSGSDRRRRSPHQAHGSNWHPGRDRLRHGFSGFRRIYLYDRNRVGDRRRRAVGPVAVSGHPLRVLCTTSQTTDSRSDHVRRPVAPPLWIPAFAGMTVVMHSIPTARRCRGGNQITFTYCMVYRTI